MQTCFMENMVKEEARMKSICKWVFEKKYDHHYSFRVEDASGRVVWHESFHTLEETKNNIPKWAILDLSGIGK